MTLWTVCQLCKQALKPHERNEGFCDACFGMPALGGDEVTLAASPDTVVPVVWRQTQLKHVPEELKAALAEEAMVRRTNVADVIVSTLAAHFGLEVDSSSRRKAFRPSLPYGDNIVLRVPEPLLVELMRAAAKWRTTRSGEALAILAEAFGVTYERPFRGKVKA